MCRRLKGKTWYQIGTVSWGSGCGRQNTPGIYTLLPNYLTWIQTVTMDAGRPIDQDLQHMPSKVHGRAKTNKNDIENSDQPEVDDQTTNDEYDMEETEESDETDVENSDQTEVAVRATNDEYDEEDTEESDENDTENSDLPDVDEPLSNKNCAITIMNAIFICQYLWVFVAALQQSTRFIQ